MVLLTVIYLCVGHRYGFHLFVVFLTSAFLNGAVKLLAHTPRPFVAFPDQLHPMCLNTATGDSFPSGHAQNAAVVWGLMAIRASRRSTRLACLSLILLIGFSRLYLQVHWPADVLGGMAIGGLVLLGYLLAIGGWGLAEAKWTPRVWIFVICVGSLAAGFLGREVDVCVLAAGSFLGSAVGYVLLEARGGYDPRASLPVQVLKFVLAFAALMAIRFGVKTLLGDSTPTNFLRYALIGFTCAFLLPTLFNTLRKRKEAASISKAAS